MKSTFRCASCKALLRFQDKAQGRSVDCPKCGSEILVPVVLGPCTHCGTMLPEPRRDWFFACVLGSTVAGLFLVPWFLRSRISDCSACGSRVRLAKPLTWPGKPEPACCPSCGGAMEDKTRSERMVTAAFAVLALVLLATRHPLLMLMGVVAGLGSVRRFGMTARSCPACSVDVFRWWEKAEATAPAASASMGASAVLPSGPAAAPPDSGRTWRRWPILIAAWVLLSALSFLVISVERYDAAHNQWYRVLGEEGATSEAERTLAGSLALALICSTAVFSIGGFRALQPGPLPVWYWILTGFLPGLLIDYAWNKCGGRKQDSAADEDATNAQPAAPDPNERAD